ncbi:MAG: hypothetical protein ABEN55_13015 [Bradymonadaceae bacterium]
MQRLIAYSCAAMLVWTVGTACGNSDDNNPPIGQDAGTQSDAAGSDAGGPRQDGSEDPPKQVVAAVDISLEPSRHLYLPDATVTASATVIDSNGNTVEDPKSMTWSHSPSGAAQKPGKRKFKLTREGSLTIEACATLKSGSEICGTKKIVVDGSRPTIQITKPKPGATLGNPQSKTLKVKGKITDSHGDVTAVLNDKRLTLADDGSFTTEIEPKFGVNTIHVVANDGVQRRDTTKTLDVLWAPRYKKLGSDLTFSFDQGVGVDLGQNFFDDRQPPIRKQMESELVTKDLADVLKLLVSNINLADQLPDPVLDSGNTTLRVTGVTLADTELTMDVTDQGLAAYLHLNQVQLQTTGQAVIEGKKLDLTGTVAARISASTSISVDKPSSDSSFNAEVTDVRLSLDQLEPNFADDKASAIFKLAEGALRTKLEDRLVGTVRQEIVDTLPVMLTRTLDSLENSLSDQTFGFSSPITGTRKIHFRGDITLFETLYRQSMFTLISNEIETPAEKDVYPNARGIPLKAPENSGIPFSEAGRVQIGVRLGMLNGILTGLWKSGFLDVNLSESLPDDLGGLIDKATIKGKLPPIIRQPYANEPYDLMLETGQLEIETEALGQTDRYGVNIRAGLNVSLKNNSLTLSIPDDPLLNSWLINTTGDSPQIGAEDLNKLIVSKVWPRIKKSLKGGLNVYLPVPNLSDLTQISPTLQNLTMNFVMERPLDIRGGYIIFDSTLQGTLPLGD